MKAIVERAFGGLMLWLLPLIAVGVAVGWLWAFLALLLLYTATLVRLWNICKPNRKPKEEAP